MQRIVGGLLSVLLLPLAVGCTSVYHAYAYDDTKMPDEKVGVLLGHYGIPSVLVHAVDDRKFSIGFIEPHPAKIYVLPGERSVLLRYTGPSSLSGGFITTPLVDGTLKINVEAGHTYRLYALPAGSGVRFSSQDLGLNYDSDAELKRRRENK